MAPPSLLVFENFYLFWPTADVLLAVKILRQALIEEETIGRLGV